NKFGRRWSRRQLPCDELLCWFVRVSVEHHAAVELLVPLHGEHLRHVAARRRTWVSKRERKARGPARLQEPASQGEVRRPASLLAFAPEARPGFPGDDGAAAAGAG